MHLCVCVCVYIHIYIVKHTIKQLYLFIRGLLYIKLYNQIHTQVSGQYLVSADTLSLGIGIGIGKGKRVSELEQTE